MSHKDPCRRAPEELAQLDVVSEILCITKDTYTLIHVKIVDCQTHKSVIDLCQPAWVEIHLQTNTLKCLNHLLCQEERITSVPTFSSKAALLPY